MDYWKAHDPIKLIEEKLFAGRLLDEATKAALVQEIESEIASAFEFAQNSPFPEVGDWSAWNLPTASPLADKLLTDLASAEFDHSQADHIPAPY
jgi:TPP-dependent pyruvate/acetoin dehydrogenase alpha subunit